MKQAALIVIILFCLLSNQSLAIINKSPVVVTEVHDGDTISIRTRSFFGITISVEKIRLIGIDAPELNQEPWGRKAKKYLKKLINESGAEVFLEYDVDRKDRYGRTLAYIWDKKGRMLNEKMIADGYALLYTVPPNVKYVELLSEAQKKARNSKLGIWGKNGLKEKPKDWRREHLN
ncbi:MAG: thermonuclease family protein [Thermodesulfovibrionales bacterium]|nr:thermonuclease family protein [Thermodesulfovibrionales bacterium]